MVRAVRHSPGRANTRQNGKVPLYVALLTPVSRDGSLDIGALTAHARNLVSAGIDGFLICGTTGEGPLLDDDEVVAATRALVDTCDGRAVVLTQVGRPSTTATARLLGRAQDAGADGVMAVAPYYYALEDAQVEAHYASLKASAREFPLYAYSIPRRTGNDLHPVLTRRLAGLGLSGIKDSTRSLERHRDYLQLALDVAPRKFAVLMGSDGFVLQALQGGSNGIVSAVANAHPHLLVDLRAAVEEGRLEDAVRLQADIDAVRESVRVAGTIAGLKAAVATRMGSLGVDYPPAVRAPLGGCA
jgi:4-hydroxy-tetrahydrodipicolinate synthase